MNAKKRRTSGKKQFHVDPELRRFTDQFMGRVNRVVAEMNRETGLTRCRCAREATALQNPPAKQ